jgi:hypothetical protein
VGKLTPRGWDFSKDAGPLKASFDLATLDAFISGGGSRVFKSVRFRDCDFQGYSSNKSQIVFDQCDFIGCDLSLSTFADCKFSRCSFESSSIGQTTFKNVEFRDCKWKKIGASSNETVFDSVFITNPAAFNDALWTQLDKKFLEQRKVKASYQWHRHEATKSTIARMLLNNHRLLGDDRTFYESVRVFETQQAYSKFCRAVYNSTTRWYRLLWFGPVAIFWLAELVLLWLFGLLNAWGASALRPLLALVALFALAAAYYRLVWKDGASSYLQTSFDITTVAGYTKASSTTLPSSLQSAMSVHLLIALILYTVFFATIVARLSRVR